MSLMIVAVACLGAAIMNAMHYVHIYRLRRCVLVLFERQDRVAGALVKLNERLSEVEAVLLDAIDEAGREGAMTEPTNDAVGAAIDALSALVDLKSAHLKQLGAVRAHADAGGFKPSNVDRDD
ncbi:hypothetical protein FF100_13740 [Methylobacterium terricola]|uniref:Uncharacterized protein n=1 Tax=Methylobacterium terricola TaxID=2583531 RepID=A0A5C4LIQ7_9HYPH|nr:hypothetical protein [Methylobacterium terricola]TNC12726.1 hypothetical protein FF100_13740 [Methylobacterium terricola]